MTAHASPSLSCLILQRTFGFQLTKLKAVCTFFFREKKVINSKDVRWIAMKDRNTSMDIGIEPT